MKDHERIGDGGRAGLRTLALAAVVAMPPIVLVCLLVARYYVPIPYWDDWRLVPLLTADQLGIGDYFRQHNEHRHFFSKLILTTIAASTSWSLRVEAVLNVVFAAVSVGALVLVARPRERVVSTPFLFAAFAVSTFLFSPAQFEVWLWPWMISSTMTTSLVCLAALSLTRPTGRAFLGAILLCLAAGLSSAHGLVSWVALLPVAAMHGDEPRIDVRRLLAWIAAGGVSWVVYMHGLEAGQAAGVIRQNLQQPADLARFALTTIGAPWTQSAPLAASAGLLQLVLFASATLVLAKTPEARRALALAGLAIWVVLFSGQTAVGRLQFGADTALSSRYLASSAVLPAAFFVLVAILASRLSTRRAQMTVLPCLCLVSAAWLYAVHSSEPDWKNAKTNRERGAACLAMADQVILEDNMCLQLIHWDAVELAGEAALIERRGIRTFRHRTPLPMEQPDGWIGSIHPRPWPVDSQQVKLTGLVADPVERPGPGLVLLDIGKDRLWCCGFTQGDFRLSAPAGSGVGSAVRWTAPLPIELLADVERVNAYALLSDPDRLVRLDGSARPERGSETVYSAPQDEPHERAP